MGDRGESFSSNFKPNTTLCFTVEEIKMFQLKGLSKNYKNNLQKKPEPFKANN